MGKMADKICFLDTNILVYAHNKDHIHCVAIRKRLQDLKINGWILWISCQVIREYISVVTRPHAVSFPIPPEMAIKDVNNFLKDFRMADENKLVTSKLLKLIKKYKIYGKQIHDTNIVATMLVNGIPNLLTFNKDDFKQFKEIIMLNPL